MSGCWSSFKITNAQYLADTYVNFTVLKQLCPSPKMYCFWVNVTRRLLNGRFNGENSTLEPTAHTTQLSSAGAATSQTDDAPSCFVMKSIFQWVTCEQSKRNAEGLSEQHYTCAIKLCKRNAKSQEQHITDQRLIRLFAWLKFHPQSAPARLMHFK